MSGEMRSGAVVLLSALVAAGVFVGAILVSREPAKRTNAAVAPTATSAALPIDNVPSPPEPRFVSYAPPPAASPSAPSPAPAAESPADQKANHIAAHHAAIAAHEKEPVDAAWARKTGDAITSDLSALAKRATFTVDSVDCRTTTCVARVTFPSYGAAMGGWQALLMGQRHTGCANEITLDDPADPQEKFQLSEIFDCKDVRARE